MMISVKSDFYFNTIVNFFFPQVDKCILI